MLYLGLGDCRLPYSDQLPSAWSLPNTSNARIQPSKAVAVPAGTEGWCLEVDANAIAQARNGTAKNAEAIYNSGTVGTFLLDGTQHALREEKRERISQPAGVRAFLRP